MLIFLGIILGFISMEFIAWLAHKFLMHGILWSIHKDHHQPTGKHFQRNDLFFLVFAIPSWLCIMLGFIYWVPLSIGLGFGFSLYGLIYFLFHEVIVHRRYNWLDNLKGTYIDSLKAAHRGHHEKVEKYDGVSFGLLIFPRKFWKKK